MQRIAVASSNISEIGYDEQSATLEVLFKDGLIYQYFDVPKASFDSLLSAPSIGQFFNKEIRGVYRFART